jgi:magnesium-transporting ATPase (P-type)
MAEDAAPAGAVRSSQAAAWHALPADEAVDVLQADAHAGLGTGEARRRLAEHGPNRLPEEVGESSLLRFLKQFHNVLIYILIAAALLAALLGEWIDFGVIIAVVVVNATIGFIQEGKAERALAAIRELLSLDAVVRRDGRRMRVPAEELVPGDVVLLESGDRVPADLRLLRARNARVEEAALTGESAPVEKHVDPVAEDALLGDRRSLAYSGTLVVAGTMTGVVVATGQHTEIGRIGELVSRVERITTPLLQKIDRFGKQLSLVIVVLSLLLFGGGWLLRDYAPAELFMIVVSFAVAAIPEGLPAILTITLALGVQRMARRNAILRRLPAVETLGSVTVICSDKTGTLTRGEMTVTRVLTARRSYAVSGSGYQAEGAIRDPDRNGDGSTDPVLEEACRALVLCNDADLSRDADTGELKPDGDPTEAALLVLGLKAGLDREREGERFPRLDGVPFDSRNRYMATLHATPAGQRVILLKGAPERLLELCDRQRSEEGDVALAAEPWRQRVDDMAAEGFRSLAVAVRHGEEAVGVIDEATVEQGGFVLLAACGIIDPPRPEAVDAVAKCRSAGIRVKMITGDHALTARTIAAQLGIGDSTAVATGRDIEGASDEELLELVRTTDVVARSSPEHKLRLVRALQALGEVTAMTGDGVNDAPALKQADIGVAMGIKGSEAAKSASEMVLADDNFASIEHAVEEGRTVYDNLRKTILFLLPTNGAEALMVVAAVVFAFAAMPITPVQILWVNMITAVTLGLALAFEPTEPGIMNRPPRARGEPILSAYMIWRIGFVSLLGATAALGFFLWELRAGLDVERARTLAVNTLVAVELCYLFNARYIVHSSLSLRRLVENRAALLAAGLLVIFQLAFTYLPLLQRWFGTAPLEAWEWLLVTGAGVAVFLIVEAEKALARRRRKWKWGGPG